MAQEQHQHEFEAGPGENLPLIPRDQSGFCGCLDCICGYDYQQRRVAYINGTTSPPSFPSNRISNQKYNVLTFIPKVLYMQFRQFYNFFFLLICVSQFFSILRVGFIFTYVTPLAFVLSVTMVKEAYEDCKRHCRDSEINSEKYGKLDPAGRVCDVTSANIKVGDVVRVREGQRVPADMVLLYTTGPSGSTFIKTDQLDGETDWKLRRPVAKTQAAFEAGKLMSMNACVTAEPPHKDIYKFQGTFYHTEDFSDPVAVGLDLGNTLWADTVLTNGFAVGLVIYTGIHTKSKMNVRSPRSKVGKIDQEISWISFVLFVVLLGLALTILTSNGFKGRWPLLYMKYVLLLSSIIPISLRVNLDLAKTWYSYGINSDSAIPGTVARNTNIPEDLGRIEMLLSDKTGTLTQNEMEFKSFFVQNAKFDRRESMHEIMEALTAASQEDSAPMADHRKPEPGHAKRSKQEQIKDLTIAMAVCHNVTPVDTEGKHDFQAASPDEIALVKFAGELGYRLLHRDQLKMQVATPVSSLDVDEYEILLDFPFTSESRKMGILVRHTKTQRIIYFMKGAEQAVGQSVSPEAAAKMREGAEDLSLEGLRTLSFAEKMLEPEEYQAWREEYDAACAAEVGREGEKAAVRAKLETGMEYLGVTGVEDKLQDNVAKTIEGLKQAGIKVWMLTGDKIETACCIGISSGLKSRAEKYYVLKEVADDQYIVENELKKVEQQKSTVLVVDGVSLDRCLRHAERLFFESTTKLAGVMCCRCSPTQKTAITQKLKLYTNMKIAAVGDGGNDVGMIQEADIGIGISGKEGKQASLASDYALAKFHYISRLFLWHGRMSYIRTSSLGQFVVHRGLIVAIIQMLFCLTFYFCAIPVFNSYLLLGYTTYYTFLPVFSLVFDQDVENEESVLKYPNLYRNLQKGRFFSAKTILIWTTQSLYQGMVVIFCTLVFFEDSFVNIVLINFSALICIEMLNLYSELKNPTRTIFLLVLMSLAIYASSVFLFRDYFNLGTISREFLLKILAITVVSWLPVHFIKCCAQKLDPSEAARVENMGV